MSDIEIAIADIGELATRELAKKHKPFGLKQNRKIAKTGGNIAKNTKTDFEKNLRQSVITKDNFLGYKYVEEKNKK